MSRSEITLFPTLRSGVSSSALRCAAPHALPLMPNFVQKGMVAMGRIQDIFSSQPDIKPAPEGADTLVELGDIEFQGLKFTYPGEDALSLKGVDIKISQGQTLGVVGVIGSGKTTLAQMLLRFHDATAGALLIGDCPIKSEMTVSM